MCVFLVLGLDHFPLIIAPAFPELLHQFTHHFVYKESIHARPLGGLLRCLQVYQNNGRLCTAGYLINVTSGILWHD